MQQGLLMLPMVIYSAAGREERAPARPCKLLQPRGRAGTRPALEKHFQQVVEKQSTTFGWAQLLLPGFEQAFGLGLLQGVGDPFQ